MSRLFSGRAWSAGEMWGFWFRVFGYGICISNLYPIFSERYGYTKVWRIGTIKIKVLRP